MRIAFDIMGGDNAPAAIIEGVLALAGSSPQDELIMVGLPEAVAQESALPANVRFVSCGSVMAMDEDVRNLLKLLRAMDENLHAILPDNGEKPVAGDI